jgi:predicted phage terminase large subunit-like protein
MSTNHSVASTDAITGFVKSLLLSRYDNPVPIPLFHREMWSYGLSGARRLAFAAPRGHAKSTSITHAFTLYRFLFRLSSYGIIVSDTESQSAQFLGDIKNELIENTALRDLFGVKRIIKDAITDIVVEMDDGHQFRIQSLGAEQKVRGRKWRNKRPDYICCDDLENDEIVESDERREKFRNWFFKALVPSLSKDGIIIVVGTIMHMDSVLMRLLGNDSWVHELYKAHDGFDDFNNILWPEQWSEEMLRGVRQEYINDGYSEGYAQEYLNDPISHGEAFFKKSDFKELEDEMRKLPSTRYASADLAISDKDKAAYSVFVVGELDNFRRLRIVHIARFRGDANEIIDGMLELQRLYDIDMWKVEEEQIARTLKGPLYEKMNERGIYMNLNLSMPTKDKRSRARAIQARMRAGGVFFDKKADWFPTLEQEMLQFPKGRYKDQVDAIAWLGIAINELAEGPTKRELEEEEYEIEKEKHQDTSVFRNSWTGY